jgi:hypothetical protein
LTIIPDATGDGGDDVVADSNKKQRTISHEEEQRSADQAVAAEQPRQTQ